MKRLPKFSHRVHIRSGRGLRPSYSIALGLLFTAVLPVILLIGLIYPLADTNTVGNYLFATLILLPILFPFVERIVTTQVEQNAFFEYVKSRAPLWGIHTVGWLLIGGYFSLVGIFAWGAALYSVRLLQLFFDLSLFQNWVGVGVLLFSATFIMRGGRSLLRNQQAILIYTLIGVLFSVLFWASRTQGHNYYPTYSYSPDASNTSLQSVPIIVLALWAIVFLFDRTTVKKHPCLLLNVAIAVLLIGTAVGVSSAVIVGLFPSTISGGLIPLLEIALNARLVVGVFFAVLVIMASFWGIRRSLLAATTMITAMTESGFLPQKDTIKAKSITIHHVPYLLIVLLTAVYLAFFKIDNLITLSVLSFFGAFLFLVVPDIFRSTLNLPETRTIKLPLHPLFPAVGALASILVISLLPLSTWLGAMIWIGFGVIIYFGYGRRRQIQLRQQDLLVTPVDIETLDSTNPYTVLVPVLDEESSKLAIQAGINIAKMHMGRVLLLKIYHTEHKDKPLAEKQEEAARLLNRLENLVNKLSETDVSIIPLVRIDEEIVHGVYDTGWEEKIDFMLIGIDDVCVDRESSKIIEHIFRRVSAETAIVKGEIPEEIRSVLVPVQGSKHTLAALTLAQDLVRSSQGKVIALYQTVGELTEENERNAQLEIEQILRELDTQQFIEPKIIQSSQFEKSLLQAAEEVDLLLFGLATEGYFQLTVLDGRPVEVADTRMGPTFLVKRKESILQHTMSRLLTLLLDWVPATTIKERAEVTLQMGRDAHASTDFYILIVLSASIAFLGLLQNSSAVIIGAMLVAPLMSPMMAMAHGLILGNFKMLQEATNSTVRGILGAIAVATVLTIFLPPQPVTDEILARTQPNYLDLLVALVSGAAGAYAACRKNLSAALPGVAIAAALVPPLCVVGYGLGIGHIDIASGALLLFLTNLASIVLASALVFLVMGYQPRREDRYTLVRRNLVRVVIAILIISIPLLYASGTSAKQAETELTVETIILQSVPPTVGDVKDIVIQSQRFGGIVVSFTLYEYQNVDEAYTYELQQQLSDAVDEPITLQVTMLKATLTVIDDAGIPTPTPPPNATLVRDLPSTAAPSENLALTSTPSPTVVQTVRPSATLTP